MCRATGWGPSPAWSASASTAGGAIVPDPSLEPMVVRKILNTREEDGSLGLWIATVTGLRHFARGRWTVFDARSSPLPGSFVLTILSVPWQGRDMLWAGTNKGLARIDGKLWTVYGPNEGLPGNEINALLSTPAPSGPPVVWAGTEKGLARFTAERWETAALPCQPHRSVRSLAWTSGPGGSSWLWVGTLAGLARVRIDGGGFVPGSCEVLTDKTRPALPDLSVVQIQVDLAGRIYLFHNDRGVTRLTPPPGLSLSAARIETFDLDDGLPGMFFNAASFRDHLGRIWAARWRRGGPRAGRCARSRRADRGRSSLPGAHPRGGARARAAARHGAAPRREQPGARGRPAQLPPRACDPLSIPARRPRDQKVALEPGGTGGLRAPAARRVHIPRLGEGRRRRRLRTGRAELPYPPGALAHRVGHRALRRRR